MDKNNRKEMLEKYKQIKTYMGVVKIMNTKNGKIYIHSYPNLKNKWLTIKAQLDMGSFINTPLQNDWKELGSEAFTYEVLEEKATDDIIDVKWELKQMEKVWLEKLTPFGDRGYNKAPPS